MYNFLKTFAICLTKAKICIYSESVPFKSIWYFPLCFIEQPTTKSLVANAFGFLFHLFPAKKAVAVKLNDGYPPILLSAAMVCIQMMVSHPLLDILIPDAVLAKGHYTNRIRQLFLPVSQLLTFLAKIS